MGSDDSANHVQLSGPKAMITGKPQGHVCQLRVNQDKVGSSDCLPVILSTDTATEPRS